MFTQFCHKLRLFRQSRVVTTRKNRDEGNGVLIFWTLLISWCRERKLIVDNKKWHNCHNRREIFCHQRPSSNYSTGEETRFTFCWRQDVFLRHQIIALKSCSPWYSAKLYRLQGFSILSSARCYPLVLNYPWLVIPGIVILKIVSFIDDDKN